MAGHNKYKCTATFKIKSCDFEGMRIGGLHIISTGTIWKRSECQENVPKRHVKIENNLRWFIVHENQLKNNFEVMRDKPLNINQVRREHIGF